MHPLQLARLQDGVELNLDVAGQVGARSHPPNRNYCSGDVSTFALTEGRLQIEVIALGVEILGYLRNTFHWLGLHSLRKLDMAGLCQYLAYDNTLRVAQGQQELIEPVREKIRRRNPHREALSRALFQLLAYLLVQLDSAPEQFLLLDVCVKQEGRLSKLSCQVIRGINFEFL